MAAPRAARRVKAGSAAPPPDIARARAWVITDGKAGDETQCLGLVETLGLRADVRRISGRAPFSWLAPWGPVDPRHAPGRSGGALAGPLPDLLLASGRQAVPYLRAIRRASAGRTFTAFLKDPRTGPASADFIWVPDYDDLRGANVLTTPTPPHRVTPARLAAARAAPDPRLAALPRPRVAVLVGGDSRHLRFSAADTARLLAELSALSEAGASLMLTVSRRTPPALRAALAALAKDRPAFFWDGSGENPYVPMLALAEAVVVTSDSANMVGEAVSTGVAVLLFELPGTYVRHRRFFAGLQAAGALAPFTGQLDMLHYAPIDATPEIARRLADAYMRHQAGIALSR
ncbi:nucleoside-diphosphate sugar epimerase [Methylobacterium sp. Leaf108]|nr:nucleoside-diphosphate sugar epimerase [Methylobacterium sp. Leaf108]